MDRSGDELDGYSISRVYADGTVVRITIRRTDDATYPSGWRYTFHYGKLTPTAKTLDDGTIRRYDNAHERTKGHECHTAAPDAPDRIDFPGIVALYERFWDEIPKSRPTTDE